MVAVLLDPVSLVLEVTVQSIHNLSHKGGNTVSGNTDPYQGLRVKTWTHGVLRAPTLYGADHRFIKMGATVVTTLRDHSSCSHV